MTPVEHLARRLEERLRATHPRFHRQYLERELAPIVEALEYYATPHTWEQTEEGEAAPIVMDIDEDCVPGDTARTCLEIHCGGEG